MNHIILYPTETVYGIGVNPFNQEALDALFALKGRDENKVATWLVRDIEDIARYAELTGKAAEIAKRFLPGPLTLVLKVKDNVPSHLTSPNGTVGFRVSSDPLTQQLIERFWNEYNAPLTCTSANVSGMPTETTPELIVEQFKKHQPEFTGFTEVIDGGIRAGSSSTVVQVLDDDIQILRGGSISELEIREITT